MFNYRSALAASSSTLSAFLVLVLHLAKSLVLFLVTFSLARYGWTLMGHGFLKSFFGTLLLFNCGAYCFWKALDLISFPLALFVFAFSDEFDYLPSPGRLFFAFLTLILFAFSIFLTVLYIRFLTTPKVDKSSLHPTNQLQSDLNQLQTD